MANLFDIPSKRFTKYLKAGTWEESKHPRGKDGKFTSAGGVAAGAGVAAAGLASAAALGAPGIRNIPGLHAIRNKILGVRQRLARQDANNIMRNLKQPGDTARAAYGGISATQWERAHTNALRHVRDQFSPAAHRRHYHRSMG